MWLATDCLTQKAEGEAGRQHQARGRTLTTNKPLDKTVDIEYHSLGPANGETYKMCFSRN